MFCSQCGKAIPDTAKFCPSCGAAHHQQANATSVPPAASSAPQPTVPPTAQSSPSFPTPPPAAHSKAQPTQPFTVPVPAPSSATTPTSSAPVPSPAPAASMPPAPSFTPPGATHVQITPAHLATFGTSVGIGLASALVLALVSTLLLTGSQLDLLKQLISNADYASDNQIDQFFNLNFFQNLIVTLVAGVSGSFSVKLNAAIFSSSVPSISFCLPMSIVGIALILGASFGAFMMAKKAHIPFRWAGVLSSLLVGIVSGLVVIILAAIFAISINIYDVSIIISGVSFRTFALTSILAAVGALIGYFLAEVAPKSSNVFTAAWTWAHQARGYVRMIIESAAIFSAVFIVLGIIAIIVASVNISDISLFPFSPLLFPVISFWGLVLGSFGSLVLSVSDWPVALNISLINTTSQTRMPSQVTQANITWVLWVMFAAALLCAIYVGLRAGARNYYDPAQANWASSWQAPVFWLVFWLVCPYLILSVQVSVSPHSFTLMPAPWFCLVAALWSFLIECFARLLAPVLIQSIPSMWTLIAGGTVRGLHDTQESAQANLAHSLQTDAFPTSPVSLNSSASPVPPASPFAPQTTPRSSNSSSAPYPGSTATSVPLASPSTQAPLPVEGAPATKALSAKSKRYLIITGIVVGLLIVLGITISVLSSTIFSATSVGKDYLSAIEQGNFDQANELVNPQVKTDQAKLLSNAAAPSDSSRITNAQVLSERTQGNEKILSISYTLDGQQITQEMKMIKKGSKALIFSDWTIAEPLTTTIQINYPDSVSTITINKVSVTEKNAKQIEGTTHTFVVYPGTYEVSTAGSLYYSEVTADITTSDDSSTPTTMNVEPTDALIDALNDAVTQKIDECAQSKDDSPSGCPFSARYFYSSSNTRNFTWSISEYPEVTSADISLEHGTFSTYGGKAKYTYEYKSYDGWDPQSDSTSISNISGSFTIEEDKVKVTFNTARE